METVDNNVVLVSYVPAPHEGYLRFFRRYPGATLCILGADLVGEFKPLTRNLPAPSPEDVTVMVRALGIFAEVVLLTRESINALASSKLIMPDEDVTRAFCERYFAEHLVTFEPVWLRWDWGSAQKNVRPPETVISYAELDRELMGVAQDAAQHSSDWWRQVGALLARDGSVLLSAFNKHMPSEHTPYHMGDPRSNFEQGASIEISTASHAERRLMASAARQGISTCGCDLYVTTFPCPPCAYSWAESGIRRLFYCEGYSSLEGANALVAFGIEIVRVELNIPPL